MVVVVSDDGVVGDGRIRFGSFFTTLSDDWGDRTRF